MVVILTSLLMTKFVLSVGKRENFVENVEIFDWIGAIVFILLKTLYLFYWKRDTLKTIIDKLEQHFPYSNREQLKFGIHRHLRNLKIFYYFSMMTYGFVLITFICLSFYTFCFDFESRKIVLLAPTYFLSSSLQYWLYPIYLIHQSGTILILLLILTATDMLFCSLVCITSIEFDILAQKISKIDPENDENAEKKLQGIIDDYNELTKIVNELEEIFSQLLFANVLTSINALCITVFLLFENPIISTTSGLFRGKQIKTATSSYYAFKGIPYAESPIGSLRFEPPVKKSWWIGIKDSFENEVRCLTLGGITEESKLIYGFEDCLYLNVYTPSMRAYLLKAVMVFIPGNIFTTEPEYSPEHLLRNDVIVVTVSYRTSVFGFLSNEDEVLSGNQGLKDILMALKWVQSNIEKFLGNPRKVTVFGQSNGAALVNYLLLSSTTTGLFSKAIMQSGSSLMPHMFQPNPQKIYQNLINKLELNYTSTKEMLEILKTLDAEKILNALTIMNSMASPFLLRPFDFVPCVEPKHVKDAFLTETPLWRLINGKFHIVSIMIGSNTNDALFLSKIISNFTSVYNLFPEFIVPLSFDLPENSSKMNSTIQELQSFYFDGRTKGTLDEWLQIYSDQVFKFPIDRIVKYYALRSYLNIYYYEFTFDGSLNYYKNLFGTSTTTHSDEIPYLFEIKTLNLTANMKATIMRERMTALWANFAKDGDPTVRTNVLLNTEWFEYRSYSRYYYEINNTLNNKRNFTRVNYLSNLQKRLTGYF
ncbi:hypothetical protein PVAND_000404 [Polypedilum vanderplanki]|uniref:Carboxylesterase type B domain-containing protein n=1 Tax=Polypedilum vanderplanki TaxID=319348 RepID=A0A9J6BK57_POLVA|nr:hypothetical protein PVAND_000404 [Polypedilum vanderplanki]